MSGAARTSVAPSVEFASGQKQPVSTYLVVALSFALLSVHPLWRYLSHARAAFALVIGTGVTMACLAVVSRSWRSPQISLAWFMSLYLGFATAFAVLYPISLRHTINTGSDREDAINVALTAIQHHQYPYAFHTYLGATITPMPGALLLASPFFKLGRVAWQNFFWLALFIGFSVRFFRFRPTALFFLLSCILITPQVLSDLTSGGDYITNFWYVTIAVAVFAWSLNKSPWLTIAAASFLGVALCSRVIYWLILAPLLAYALQRVSWRRIALSVAALVIAFVAVAYPVFAPHPVMHMLAQIHQQSGKMRYLPVALHAPLMLPLLGVLISLSSFRGRMTLPRVYLTYGVAALSMLVPTTVSLAMHYGKPVQEFNYLAAGLLPVCLWALARLESTELAEELYPSGDAGEQGMDTFGFLEAAG